MHRPVTSPELPAPGGFYSPAVQAGSMLFISGQIPVDRERRIIGITAAEQAAVCLENIRKILDAAGAAFSNLVQVVVYLSDIEYWPEINQVYQSMLGDVPVPPARAVVAVKELHYGVKVEIQAIAYLGA